MPDMFAPVVPVPPEISIRDAGAWLNTHLPAPHQNKAQLILFDGREVSDDTVGVKNLLATLNQILRKRSDILFCWPTTDSEWHGTVRATAEQIGGANFAPTEADCTIVGPPSSEWPKVLDRLLLQFGKTHADVGLPADLVGKFCEQSSTAGDFLTRVGTVIAERVTKTRVTKRLPQLVFIITSSGEVVGEANRIRRAGTQGLNPEPLLGHSPRSEVGKWWAERNKNANHHLGYIISLFDARLVTMSASAVVHSCMHHGETALTQAVKLKGARPDKGNAKRTIEASEFFRFLKSEEIPEFTSAKKGTISKSTESAYAAIQSMSVKKHKAINQALCQLVREHLADLQFNAKSFEVVLAGEVVTDAQVTLNSTPLSLEFHHVSKAQCRASGMASYIMDKLRTYAIYHQLIPR
jgi:hypothetical protein